MRESILGKKGRKEEGKRVREGRKRAAERRKVGGYVREGWWEGGINGKTRMTEEGKGKAG